MKSIHSYFFPDTAHLHPDQFLLTTMSPLSVHILASDTAYVNWSSHLTRPPCCWAYVYVLLPVHARPFREALSSRPSKAPWFLLCYSGRRPRQAKGIAPGMSCRV